MATMLAIADAARASGLGAHTLRCYEGTGPLDPVDNNGGGHRRCTDENLEGIRFSTKLRATGMPIREVRRYADLLKAGEENECDWCLLEAHREGCRTRLDDTVRNLEVEWKINLCRERLEPE